MTTHVPALRAAPDSEAQMSTWLPSDRARTLARSAWSAITWRDTWRCDLRRELDEVQAELAELRRASSWTMEALTQLLDRQASELHKADGQPSPSG